MEGRRETAEGLEYKLQLHYFGRMYFIEKLLPLLRASKEGGKVLSVLSAGVHSPYENYQQDFEVKTNYSLSLIASVPGMYNDLCLDAYSRQPGNERVAFIHSAPGVVNTNYFRDLPWYVRTPAELLLPYFTKSIDDAGELMSDALIGGDIQTGFHLLDQNGNPTKVTTLHTPAARDFVYEKTQEIIKRIASSL